MRQPFVDIRVKPAELTHIQHMAAQHGLSARKLVLLAVSKLDEPGVITHHFQNDGVVRHAELDKEWCTLCV